jgi:hypothetical protein
MFYPLQNCPPSLSPRWQSPPPSSPVESKWKQPPCIQENPQPTASRAAKKVAALICAEKLPIKKRGRKRLNHKNLICLHCGSNQTPEWRKGPLGGNTLCNACGLQYAKIVKRENAIRNTGGNLLNRMKIDYILN